MVPLQNILLMVMSFKIKSCIIVEINIFQCCTFVYKIITAVPVLQNCLPVAQKF